MGGRKIVRGGGQGGPCPLKITALFYKITALFYKLFEESGKPQQAKKPYNVNIAGLCSWPKSHVSEPSTVCPVFINVSVHKR